MAISGLNKKKKTTPAGALLAVSSGLSGLSSAAKTASAPKSTAAAAPSAAQTVPAGALLAAETGLSGLSAAAKETPAPSKTSSVPAAAPPVQTPVLPDAVTGLSAETLAGLALPYVPDARVTAAREALSETLARAPGEAPDDGWLRAMFEGLEAQPFSYDLAADPLYRQARDEYVSLGERAMRDAVGEASGLTGGYASSYAERAGQEAYGDFLQSLYALAPEFSDRAYSRWRDGQEDAVARYAQAAALYDRTYDAWRDEVRDWQSDRSAAQSALEEAEELSFSEYEALQNYWLRRAALENSDAQWRLAFARQGS